MKKIVSKFAYCLLYMAKWNESEREKLIGSTLIKRFFIILVILFMYVSESRFY